MSQPPYYNFFSQQQPYPQQPQYQYSQPYPQQQPIYQQQPYQQHQLLMQQHQLVPTQQVPLQQPYYVPPPQPMQTAALPQKQPHWFEKMCEVITTQQSRHEAGSLDTPPMLTPGNYFQWASRFSVLLNLRNLMVNT